MPNICIGTVSVRGYKGNVDEFIRIIQSNYDYIHPDAEFHKPHFWRVFQADVFYYEEYGLEVTAQIGIECAWSVACCMLPGQFSYYDENKDDITRFGTNAIEVAKKLNLDIEIYSVEGGMCFQEHYRILSGIMTKDECEDYYEIYIGEYDTYEDLLEDYPPEENDFPQKCGIKSKEDFDDFKDSRIDYVSTEIDQVFSNESSKDLVAKVMCKTVNTKEK